MACILTASTATSLLLMKCGMVAFCRTYILKHLKQLSTTIFTEHKLTMNSLVQVLEWQNKDP